MTGEAVEPGRRELEVDLAVIGGGLAGVCAAIAAAREGLEVALLHNRTVLGGNSSSEVRVWVCGASAHGEQHYARETGVMGELWLENQYRNPQGNPHLWDLVLREAVRAEGRIALLLDTDVREVDVMEDATGRRIRSIGAWSPGTQRATEVRAAHYVDASGDGFVGFLAGADHRLGREARADHDEELAPVAADGDTLGSTLLYYVKDTGRPIPFVPPAGIVDIGATAIPMRREIRARGSGCEYWWIELGGDRDVVDENDAIRDELHAVVFGIWDYIKNSGRFPEAETLDLEWVGSLPGKREYRRLLGDHLLTEHDVLAQPRHADAVTFGGWSLDLHPPGGVFSEGPGSYHWYGDGTYDIPLRCLYSRNVVNLWMAGRDISATHVAFGSARVMATCAAEGEAVGLAAAVALQHDVGGREVAGALLPELRRRQVRADSSMQGLTHDDPADLVVRSHVTASSTERALEVVAPHASRRLDTALALVLPVDPALADIEVLLDVERPTELVARLHATSGPRNYHPAALIAERRIQLTPSTARWVPLGLVWQPEDPANAVLVLEPDSAVSVRLGEGPLPGVTALERRERDRAVEARSWRPWRRLAHRELPCFRAGSTDAYAARQAGGGHARPWAGPHMWLSRPMREDPQPVLEAEWDHPADLEEIGVVFDDDLEEDLVNLHHHETPFRVMPELVADYTLEVRENEDWREVARIQGNRHRAARHEVTASAVTGVRLRVLRTNGAARAHVVGLRAWRTSS